MVAGKKTGMMMKSYSRHISAFIMLAAAFLLYACSDTAPTVIPEEARESNPEGDTGTTALQVQRVYPDASSGAVPADTEIVIVFNKPVDESTLSAAVTVGPAGVPEFSIIAAGAGRAARIIFDNPLAASSTYTVDVSAAATDLEGHSLEEPFSSEFVTLAGDAELQPEVLAVFPGDGTVADVGISEIEVYFTRDMDETTLSPASFTVSGSVADGDPYWTDSRSCRLRVNTLSYGTTYTASLSAALTDQSGAAMDAYSWSFTAEADPSPTGAYGILSFWVSDVTDSSAVINWIGQYPTEDINNLVEFGRGTGYGSTAYAGPGGSMSSVYSVELTSLDPASRYYFRISSSAAGTVTETGSFLTAENYAISGDSAFDTAAGSKTSLLALSADMAGALTGNTFSFWLNGTSLRGQYFENTGSVLWAAGGEPLHSFGASDGVRAFPDGCGGALAAVSDGSGFYVKHLADSAGSLSFNPGNATVAGWSGVNSAAASGLTFGHTAGYNLPSAVLVHSGLENNVYRGRLVKQFPGPSVTAQAVTEMQGYGDAALVFDSQLNFLTLAGFNTGDYAALSSSLSAGYGSGVDIASILSPVTLDADASKYTFYEAADTIGDASDCVLLDSVPVLTAAADGHTLIPPQNTGGTAVYTTAYTTDVSPGDIIYNISDVTGYAYVTACDTFPAYDRVLISHDIGLNDGESFGVYKRLEGLVGAYGTLFTTESKAMALYDNDSSFTAAYIGSTVFSERNGSGFDISDIASYQNAGAVRLSANIMNDNYSYWIVSGVPAGSVAAFGKRDAGGPVNTAAITGVHYGDVNTAAVGDIIFNITRNRYAAVRYDNGTSLSLSRPIVNAAADTDTLAVLDSTHPLLDIGQCTAGGAGLLNDTGATFVDAGISAGDTVYCSDGASGYDELSVEAVNSQTQLAVSGSTVSGRHYYIVQPRVLFAWTDSAGDIRGRYINLRDGSAAGTEFFITNHANSMTGLKLAADGSGGGLAVYQSSGGTIRAKRLDAKGVFLAGTNSASEGVSLGTATLVDAAFDGSGGLYLLYESGGSLLLRRWDASLTAAGVTWASAVTLGDSGYASALAVDSNGRPAAAFSGSDGAVRLRCFTAGGSSAYTQTAAASGFAGSLSIVSAGSGAVIVSWADGSGYSTIGYSYLAQRYSSSGTPGWDSDEGASADYSGYCIGIPSVIDSALLGTAAGVYGTSPPYSGLFMWYDYRDGARNIYFDVKQY